MSDNQHITQTEFYEFQNDLMKLDEKERFLEHICTCDYCSDQFAAVMSEQVITAPRDMKAKIMKATMRPEVQFAIKVKESSKRMQLLIYSLKVGTATIGALILLVLTMNFTDFNVTSNNLNNTYVDVTSDEVNNASLTKSIRKNMNFISNSMLDFSNNIMKAEVTDNDQEEK